MKPDFRLEVCVDDVAGFDAAVAGGADRIELCSALGLGGLTPSGGFMTYAAQHQIAVRAMIRPRPGDFVYSAGELDVMRRDIDAAREAGLEGVVFGVSTPSGALDPEALQRLCTHAAGLGRTLHRAFDLTPEPLEALQIAKASGFDTILTSGGATSATQGLPLLRRLSQQADGEIEIMAGSGVTADNAIEILKQTGAPWLHASCSVSRANLDPSLAALGFSPPVIKTTDSDVVSRLRRIGRSLHA